MVKTDDWIGNDVGLCHEKRRAENRREVAFPVASKNSRHCLARPPAGLSLYAVV